jgi:methionyl-tRNA formyltransferase
MSSASSNPLVCIAGKQQVAVSAAAHLRLAFPDLALCIVPTAGDNGHDNWQPSLRKWAAGAVVPTATLDELFPIENLLFVSLQFDQILRPAKFKTRRLYNIHFSHLPEYKGMYTAIWPILEGRGYSGATLHHIDAGIDTGDIIAQEKIAIEPDLTSRGLYMKCVDASGRLFREHFPKLLSGAFSSRPQPAEGSTYRSMRSLDLRNVALDLNQTAACIRDQIRAYTFPEYQLPLAFGHPVSASTITGARSTGKPGSVVLEHSDRIEISTVDYNIVLHKDPFECFVRSCDDGINDEAHFHLSRITDLEGRNSRGWTPLMVAAYHADFALVTVLLDRGANPNATNWKGTSVLMYAKSGAVRSGRLDCISPLLTSGANPLHRDHSGRNLLDYAEAEGATAVLNLLAAQSTA